MKTELIARIPILYRSKLYQPGEVLPTDDIAMVAAWQEAKSAVYRRTETVEETIVQEAESEDTVGQNGNVELEEKNIEESNELEENEDSGNPVKKEDSDMEPDAPTEPEKESKKQDASRGKTKGRNNK